MAAPSIIARYSYDAIVSGASNTTVSTDAKPVEAVDGRLCLLYLNSYDSVVGSCVEPAFVTEHVNNYTANGTSTCHTFVGSRILDGTETWPISFTIHGNGADDKLVMEIYPSGCTVGAVVSSAAQQNTSFTTPALTTTAADSFVHFSIGVKNGNAFTATPASSYPSGTTQIELARSRPNSAGGIYGGASKVYASSGTNTDNESGGGAGSTAKTWPSVATTNQWGITVAVEIKAAPGSITSIDPIVMDDGSNTFTSTIVTDGLGTLTSVDIATAGAGNHAATLSSIVGGTAEVLLPLWTEDEEYPYPGTVTITAVGTLGSATTTTTLSNAVDYLNVAFDETVTTDPTFINYHLSLPPISKPLVDGVDIGYWKDDNGLVINPDGGGSATSETTTILYVHREDNTIDAYNVTINEGGVVPDGVKSVTAIGITTRSITMRGITS